MAAPEHTDNLLRKTAGGAGWTISWRAATRVLGLLSTLVLVRILAPADFGLVALATSFTSAVDVFAEFGVRDALIRETHPDRDAYDTAFTMNLIRGLVTAALVAASAGLFARLLGDPRLHGIVLVIAFTILLDGLENIAIADFRRYLDFHREFQLLIFPRIAQVVITLGLAFILVSYWALVVGIVAARLLQTIASYVMHPYRPRLTMRSWRSIASFSAWTWLLSMARVIKDRCVIMIIGGMLDASRLGVYSVGSEIAMLPETELIGPLGRASFSGFAAARRAGLSVPDTWLRIVASTLVIAVPASIGISSLAWPIVLLAFGAKWVAAVPVLEIIAVAGALGVLARISMSLFNAFAYFPPLLWSIVTISVLQLVLLFPLVWCAGIVGAALAVSIAALAQQTLLSALVFRRFGIRVPDLLSRIWRCLAASALMIAALVLSGLGWTASGPSAGANIRQLLLASMLGGVVYIGSLLGLWLLSGKPDGPELDVLSLIRTGGSRLLALVTRRTALLRPTGSR
jgi:O-antigen/teichoic acid export membrane protein